MHRYLIEIRFDSHRHAMVYVKASNAPQALGKAKARRGVTDATLVACSQGSPEYVECNRELLS